MCWNKDVSLNTFLFSSFVLVLIIYNNAFTKYKIQSLNDIRWYLLIASIISMQLAEFFIWKNIHNTFYNNVFSIVALIILILQPFFSIMLLSNLYLRNVLHIVYLLLVIPFVTYTSYNHHIHTAINENGNLRWLFIDTKQIPLWIIWLGWLFFFLFSFIYEGFFLGVAFALVTLLIVFLNYKDGSSAGSKWCWAVNSFMIFCAIYLLIFLPFQEKMKLC